MSRHLVFALGVLGLGCASAPPAPDRVAQERALVAAAERLACLEPATQQGCEPGLTARFELPESVPYGDVRSIAIRCQDGQPHAHIVTRHKEIDGPFGQVVWEAISRVLQATGGCASVGNTPASNLVVTGLPSSSATPHTCVEPRLYIGRLFTLVYNETRQGPPRLKEDAEDWTAGSSAEEGPLGYSICEIDPDACQWPPSNCPEFNGDPWNGVVAKRRQSDQGD